MKQHQNKIPISSATGYLGLLRLSKGLCTKTSAGSGRSSTQKRFTFDMPFRKYPEGAQFSLCWQHSSVSCSDSFVEKLRWFVLATSDDFSSSRLNRSQNHRWNWGRTLCIPSNAPNACTSQQPLTAKVQPRSSPGSTGAEKQGKGRKMRFWRLKTTFSPSTLMSLQVYLTRSWAPPRKPPADWMIWCMDDWGIYMLDRSSHGYRRQRYLFSWGA